MRSGLALPWAVAALLGAGCQPAAAPKEKAGAPDASAETRPTISLTPAAAGIAEAPARSGVPADRKETPGGESPDARQYDDQIRPFLVKHCQACHAGEKPKGAFRLDKLAPDFDGQANRERWLAVSKRLKAGEMPPKSKPRPPEQEVQALCDWIGARADAAAARRAAEGRAVVRRLNRVEYENTVRDLLGVEIDLKEMLPVDMSAHGFDNNGEALHSSSFLMERYLDTADAALDAAIADGPKPQTTKKRYSYKDERQINHEQNRRLFRRLDDGVVFFSSTYSPTTLWEFYPPARGKYRFRISAHGFQSSGKPVTFRVQAGDMLMGGKNHLVDYFDAPADTPTVVEFVDLLPAHGTIHIVPYGTGNEQAVAKAGADKYDGAGLAVQWVEVEGPLIDAWPPESHRRLFGDLAREPVAGDRTEVVSQSPAADAERLLRDFTRRAFRRAVTDDDLKPYVDLVKDKLAEKYSFEQAMRVGFKAVLVSPDFLFLREKPGKLDDFALASRLSYFLWSAMPDEELLTLAGRRQLGRPDALREQVERMLKDPKAAAFTENFVGQWLGLRDVNFTVPDQRLYPEFDDMLKEAMVKEAQLFFDEVLKDDLSLTNFVASDFTMLNDRLAKHYGVPGVEGHRFRKATLPADSHRGGVLTMAGVLKVTANGTNTSPVVRGAWVMDRILGTPPPRPPPGVPAIEPDIRGATTIREQLAKHRAVATCATCHARIDPPGFALESFDVIGGWRENYRSVGNGEEVIVDGRRMPYLKGPKVDPADELPDGRRFRDVDEFKRLLLKDKDQLARALTEKLLTYATGRAPDAADGPDVEEIVRKIRDKDYGLRTLVQEIVQSRLFQEK
jgi:hypothetical protein